MAQFLQDDGHQVTLLTNTDVDTYAHHIHVSGKITYQVHSNNVTTDRLETGLKLNTITGK